MGRLKELFRLGRRKFDIATIPSAIMIPSAEPHSSPEIQSLLLTALDEGTPCELEGSSRSTTEMVDRIVAHYSQADHKREMIRIKLSEVRPKGIQDIAQAIKGKFPTVVQWQPSPYASSVSSLCKLVEQVAIKSEEICVPVVIIFEDIEQLGELAEPLFGAVRALYNKRPSNINLFNVTFLAAGTCRINDMIKDGVRWFNIGRSFHLP